MILSQRKVILVAGCYFVTVFVLLGIIGVLIAFVILPNSYQDKASGTSSQQFLYFVLALVSSVIFLILIISTSVILVLWIRYHRNTVDYPVSTPINSNSQVTYRSTSKNFDSDKRSSILQSVDTFFNPTDIKSDLVQNFPPSAILKSQDRSSFAEDLFRSFKSIQITNSIDSNKGKRNILYSVDEEGYHFDNSVFGQEENGNSVEEEYEIDITQHPHSSTHRLDQFDKNLLLGVNISTPEGGSNSGYPTSDFESIDLKDESNKSESSPERSFQLIEDMKPFDKYLSLIKIDTDLETTTKDQIRSGSISE